MFLRCLQGEIIERVWATLPDVPCHGHTLLSSGLKKFNHSDVVPDGDHLAFANYSLLAGPGRLQIPTERSGITIPQIQALLAFVYGMIGVSKPGLWAASFGEEHGRPLSFDTFNLYHADEWIIRPATAAVPGSSHGTGCSYVELLGNKFSYFSWEGRAGDIMVWYIDINDRYIINPIGDLSMAKETKRKMIKYQGIWDYHRFQHWAYYIPLALVRNQGSWQRTPMLRCRFGSSPTPGLSQSSCFWRAFAAMQPSVSFPWPKLWLPIGCAPMLTISGY